MPELSQWSQVLTKSCFCLHSQARCNNQSNSLDEDVDFSDDFVVVDEISLDSDDVAISSSDNQCVPPERSTNWRRCCVISCREDKKNCALFTFPKVVINGEVNSENLIRYDESGVNLPYVCFIMIHLIANLFLADVRSGFNAVAIGTY